LRRKQFLAYLGCSFSIGVFSAFNNFTLSLWLTSFTSSYILISLLANSKSFEGAIVSPLAGAWSDRTWMGWLGRRRPFILTGGLLSALLLALTPIAGRLAGPTWLGGLPQDLVRLAPAIGLIFLFTLTFNVMDDIHKALLADLTEGAERNWLSSLSVVIDIGGQVGILVLGFLLWSESVPDSAFAVTALLMAGGVLLTVAGVREPPAEKWAAEQRKEARAGGARASLLTVLTDYRGAAVLCVVKFAYWSGVNAVMPLVSIYTRDILGASVGEAQLLPALLLLSTTLLAIPMGRLGTRYGKRRMISAGYAIMAAAALAGLVITTREQGAALFLMAGIGNAAIIVLTIPLLADLVPRQHMGIAAGALAASGSVAAPLSSLVAGGLSDLYGPRAIFWVMVAMTCIALALMPFVRNPTPVSNRESLVPSPQ
jgi:MFS family permease